MHKGQFVWLDGKFIPHSEAYFSVFSHSLHYGYGAFEGIRAYEQPDGKGAIFRLQDHVYRLFETLKILLLSIDFTPEDLIQACLELCRRNQFTECYIRPIVFIGEGSLGIYPGAKPQVHTAILTWKWGNYLGDDAMSKGARLKISSFIRPHVNACMSKGKITGQYVNSVLAKTEARMLGFDEALMLDEYGFLTEGSGENLFIIKEGAVKTTPLNSILNGITRQTVVALLEHQGYCIQQMQFSRDELWCADEVFLTGTAAEITPVQEIDFRTIGSAFQEKNRITKKLQSLFHELVRGRTRIQKMERWLTVIEKV